MIETNRYDDIIKLKRPELKNHPRASRESRASQFGAFRCLTGYEDAVAETARYTENMPIVSEQMIDEMNRRIGILVERLDESPELSLTYFVPDEKKAGGRYVTVMGQVKKIDDFRRLFVMQDGREIPIESILELEGKIFA